MTTFRPGFDPKKATTWNTEEQAVYETGYREGESNHEADWTFALSEECTLPDDLEQTPTEIAKYIDRLQQAVRDARAGR